MAKGVVKWVLFAVAAGLAGLGLLFIIAAYEETTRFAVGLILITVAVLLAYFAREQKPVEIRQEVTVTGPVTVKELRCPNCGALLNAETVQVYDGKPYMTCDYCGNRFEVTEEPTW